MCDELLKKIQRQFFCWFTINSTDWQDLIKRITWSEQKLLIDKTCKHPLNVQYPIKISYQLKFLKQLISCLEKECKEIHDIIYQTLCELHQKELRESHAFRHYILSNNTTKLSFLESTSFVLNGTTGLTTWPASMALAEYLFCNRDLISGKRIVELGSGTGLCGIVSVLCEAKSVVITDGSDECIKLLRNTVLQNFDKIVKQSPECFHLNDQSLNIMKLQWDAIDKCNTKLLLNTDLILAADVVYDSSVFNDLIKAINHIFNTTNNNVGMLLATTVRNQATLNKFLDLLVDLTYKTSECINVISEDNINFYWDRTTEVKIYYVTKIK